MANFRDIVTFDQALDYLYSFINYETDSPAGYSTELYNVARVRALLEGLGRPDENLDILHVAGTKGKGSVCAIMDGVLRAGGRSTGLFTSPHVDRINERISAGGRLISDQELVGLVSQIAPVVDSLLPPMVPTTFEILTALAMGYFAGEEVECVILETGMGGRFDATNFASPLVSVITSISYDHMDKLGDTVEKIASEKAEIIKRGRPAVIGYQRFDVRDVFVRKARREGSPLTFVSDICSFEVLEARAEGSRFHADIAGRRLDDLFLSLAGEHQVENCVTALCALGVAGILPPERTVREALARIRLQARLESITIGGRRFLLDSAHNGDSSRALCEAVESIFPHTRIVTVVGIVKGKDYRGILEPLTALSDRVIVTEPVTHKELDTPGVLEEAKRLMADVRLVRDFGEAIRTALSVTVPEDIILVTGSFYTVAPARSLLTAL